MIIACSWMIWKEGVGSLCNTPITGKLIKRKMPPHKYTGVSQEAYLCPKHILSCYQRRLYLKHQEERIKAVKEYQKRPENIETYQHRTRIRSRNRGNRLLILFAWLKRHCSPEHVLFNLLTLKDSPQHMRQYNSLFDRWEKSDWKTELAPILITESNTYVDISFVSFAPKGSTTKVSRKYEPNRERVQNEG